MEKVKFRNLSPMGKVKYIFKDFIWQVILGGILIFLMGSWIWTDFIAEQPILHVEMIDAEEASPNGEAFVSLLAEECSQTGRNTVDVSKQIQFAESDDEAKCDPYLLITCKIFSERTDVYFWNDDHMEQRLKKGGLMDLREILPPEVIAAHKENLVFTDRQLKGGYPCGIRLHNNRWVRDNGYYESCTVGVADTAEDPQMAAVLLCRILGKTAPKYDRGYRDNNMSGLLLSSALPS